MPLTSSKNWKTIKLGDIVSIKHGFAFKGEYFSTKETKNILLTPGNFLIGGGWKDGKKYYDGPIPDEYVLKAGDLVVTMTDLSKEGDTLGFPALIPDKSDKIFLHNQRVGLVEVNEDEVSKDFIYYLMRTRDYQKSIVNSATGSTVKHTSPTKIGDYEFLLPPLSEQREIAAILGSLDDKIELLRKENNTLESIAQTLFKEWFVDFRFPGATGKMVDSELGMIPEGWRVGKLGDIGDIVCGKTPSKSNQEFFGGQVPFIKIPDMHGQMFIVKTEDSLTLSGADTQRNKYVPENSICVSCIATVGLVSITTEASQTNQQINSIIPKDEHILQYLYFVLKSMSSDLQMIGGGGSATLNVNTGVFSNIEINIPNSDILNLFSNTVSSQFGKIKLNFFEIQTLSKLRDKILNKIFK